MKKTGKYLIPLIGLVVTFTVVFSSISRNKSFKGKIETLTTESYRVRDSSSCLPTATEVLYQVKRLKVRTEKGEILDLAVYSGDLNEESIGKFVKGSYRPGNVLEIKGENVILGFIDFPGPKIELKGNPAGVMKRYRIVQ